MCLRYFQGILSFICLAAAGTTQAAVHAVTNLDDTGAGSLREAIEQAVSGDTIVFEENLAGFINLNSPLPALDFDLTIDGPGADVIGVSGEGMNRVFFIDLDATVTISGITICCGFEEFGFGGGIWNLGSLAVQDCVIEENFAGVSGGGISNEGTLALVRTTVSNNAVSLDGFGVGGGIENFEGTATIVDSTISGNAADFGGGMENAVDADGAVATLTVLNSTISGNGASELGGGIDNFGGDVTLQFSTIAENSAITGGGVLNDGAFTARNSLVARNSAGGDCSDTGTSFSASGDNLDTDASCPGFTQATSVALDLGPLADNGGPTETHAPGATSTAVDAAAECTEIGGAIVENDQRGVPRPQGAECDIGAFERSGDGEVLFADGFEGQ